MIATTVACGVLVAPPNVNALVRAPDVVRVGGARAESGVWPVDPPRIIGGYDPPDPNWLAGHRGIDLAATAGQPVRAIAGGRVAFTGLVGGRATVVVELADGRRTTYQPVRGVVRAGQFLSAGSVLGHVVGDVAGERPAGSPPAARLPAARHCLDSCLHVGLRTPQGYADPLSLLTRPPAVLKPLR